MHSTRLSSVGPAAPLAAASGAHYISAHSPQRMYQYVREAFWLARHERKPVVLGVPYDLQKQPLPNIGEYQPSSAVLPHTEPTPPHPHQIAQLVDKLTGGGTPPAKPNQHAFAAP